MSHLETTKANLKRLASDSLELALKELERLLSPESPLFNSFLLLKGQFKKCREEFLLGILSAEQNTQTYARLMSAFLQMTGELSQNDLIPEKETAQKPAEKRGELLYHVPHTMQAMREEKCVVRIAWTEAALFENWTRKKDEVRRRNLRIAEVMGVELLSLSEDAPFSIKSLHSTVQFLDDEEYTEWIFYVKPLRVGNYPLVIRISVIEMRDNREVKRELVLEEQVSITTEAPQVEAGQEDMVRAPLAHFAAGAPFVEAPAFLTEVMRRYGALLALILVGAMALFMPKKWGNDDIVVVPPNDNDSTKVDTNKLELNLFQPFQDEKSHIVLDESKDLQNYDFYDDGIYFSYDSSNYDSSKFQLLPNSDIELSFWLYDYKEAAANKARIERMFSDSNYRILHIATHGIAIPDTPAIRNGHEMKPHFVETPKENNTTVALNDSLTSLPISKFFLSPIDSLEGSSWVALQNSTIGPMLQYEWLFGDSHYSDGLFFYSPSDSFNISLHISNGTGIDTLSSVVLVHSKNNNFFARLWDWLIFWK